jgi:mRNA interferase HicA
MKRLDLERHLREHGCEFLRHGGRHDVWFNPVTDSTAALPRPREIKAGTTKAVCRDLGVPVPPSAG